MVDVFAAKLQDSQAGDVDLESDLVSAYGTWDITDTLNASLGFRYYDLEYGFKGYGAWRYGNRPLFVDDDDPNNDIRPNRTGGRDYEVNLDLIEPLKTDDTIVKFTVSWAPGYRKPAATTSTSPRVSDRCGVSSRAGPRCCSPSPRRGRSSTAR